jgi:riboflavin biosynthesis pyrimidine reductase
MEIIAILEMLGDMGIQALLVEGGVETWKVFLESGLVDRVRTCRSQTSLEEGGKKFDTDMTRFGMTKVTEEEIGGDVVSWWE